MKWPDTDEGVVALTNEVIGICGYATHCAIERVWASPQMGVVSAFTFGGAYKSAKVLMLGNRIKLIEPTPQQWQKAMNCRTGGDKSITKRKAQALFPHTKVTNYNADALLLAEYCRRVSCGILEPPSKSASSSTRAAVGSGSDVGSEATASSGGKGRTKKRTG